MRVQLPLIGPSYTNRELPLSAQVTQNLMAEIHPESRNVVALHAYPGLTLFSTLTGADRGLFEWNDELYAIAGTTLSRISSAGTATTVGTVAGSGLCDFAASPSQLIITTGGTAYAASRTAVAAITDPDLVNPTTVGYLNSQFIYDQNSGTQGQFITSAAGDGTDIDALDFATAESHPDDILRIIVQNQLVNFMGGKTIEPWFNSGVGSPPFDRVQGAVKPYGLAGKDAVGVTDESIYFLDDQRIPRRMVGLAVTPIGNPSIGVAWREYSTVSDAVGFAFTFDNQVFFQLTFPTANKSWLYQESSNSWGELASGVDGARHRAQSHAYVYGKNIVADHSTGLLFELDPDVYTDNGAVIQRKRATATIHSKLYASLGAPPGVEVFYNRVGFVVQTGEGLTTGQGSDPQLMIRFSDDSGRTWSAEDWYPLGAGGDYLRRVELTNQGRAFDRIYELTYTDPTKFTLIDAWADVSFGI